MLGIYTAIASLIYAAFSHASHKATVKESIIESEEYAKKKDKFREQASDPIKKSILDGIMSDKEKRNEILDEIFSNWLPDMINYRDELEEHELGTVGQTRFSCEARQRRYIRTIIGLYIGYIENGNTAIFEIPKWSKVNYATWNLAYKKYSELDIENILKFVRCMIKKHGWDIEPSGVAYSGISIKIYL